MIVGPGSAAFETVVARDERIRTLVPLEPTPFETAVRKALQVS
jgi:hypothetical protein